MSTEQPCPGCGIPMSQQALAHHYPFVHGPRPLLVPDFYQRGDGIIRCLVTRDDGVTPWCLAQTATPETPAQSRQASLF